MCNRFAESTPRGVDDSDIKHRTRGLICELGKQPLGISHADVDRSHPCDLSEVIDRLGYTLDRYEVTLRGTGGGQGPGKISTAGIGFKDALSRRGSNFLHVFDQGVVDLRICLGKRKGTCTHRRPLLTTIDLQPSLTNFDTCICGPQFDPEEVIVHQGLTGCWQSAIELNTWEPDDTACTIGQADHRAGPWQVGCKCTYTVHRRNELRDEHGAAGEVDDR